MNSVRSVISLSSMLAVPAPRTGNGQRSPRYHCARKTCVGKVPSVKAATVHNEFVETLKPSDEALRLYKKVLIKESNSSLDNLNVQITKTRNTLNEISVKRSAAINKFIEGGNKRYG